MISVSTARELILHNTKPLAALSLPLKETAGLTLAEDLYAGHDFPPFEQSSMDGYAFCFEQWNKQPLSIAGVVQAGATEELVAPLSQAVRIFTGAPLPAGLDTVVMQEKVTLQNGLLYITDEELQPGTNVRPKGSEITKGSLALEAGTRLVPGAAGFIAGLGINAVHVFPKPVVSILVTGKELQQPGKPLEYGQVYESNSYALITALAQIGITEVTTHVVDDDLEVLTEVIRRELLRADLILLTGGVSVGAYDFVAQALAACGAITIFHKIKQRPGKPLLFAKKEEKVIFGLPGNPSSVLTCYYQYVLLAIQKLMNLDQPFITKMQVPIATDYKRKAGLTHFLKARISNGSAVPLDGQESYKMSSFAVADCLLVLEEERSLYKKGDLVEVHLLGMRTP